MPPRFAHALGRAAERIPGLRNVPVVRLLLVAEIALVARDHIELLTPRERRRLVTLVKEAKGRPRAHLSPAEHAELQALVAKAEPRLFAREAASRLAPARLPKRFRNRA